jgi:exodeoxyribonuclease (lambda-induced)
MAVNFTVINAPQRSPEWRIARAGRLTGSMAHTILMQGRKKGEESKVRRDYRLQLISERIAGESQDNFFWTQEMQRGVDIEPLAFAHYESLTGQLVRKTGFLAHNTVMAGCSLDGDVGNFSGILELKCPKMATHLAYLADRDQLRIDYLPQVSHNLWITGAAFCDLVSFDNRMPPDKQFIKVRIEAYDAGIKEYAEAATAFLAEVDTHYHLIMDSAYG